MTRRKRTLIYGAIAFVIAVILIIATAYSQGADPFHPRTRHIWALSLIAALYASFRGALLFERLGRTWNKTGFGLFKQDHAIDKRMAARRDRVAAAKAREAEQSAEQPPEQGPEQRKDDDTVS